MKQLKLSVTNSFIVVHFTMQMQHFGLQTNGWMDLSAASFKSFIVLL